MTIPASTLADYERALARHRLTLLAVHPIPAEGWIGAPFPRRSWWLLAAPGTNNCAMEITFGPGGIVLFGDNFEKPIGTSFKGLTWWLGELSQDYLLGEFLRREYDHDRAMLDVLERAKDLEGGGEADCRRWQAVYDSGADCDYALADAMEEHGFTDVWDYGLGMVYPQDTAARLIAAHRRFRQLHQLNETWNVGDTAGTAVAA